MESNRSTSYTCNVVSRSLVYIMIVNLNHYGQKWMILSYPSIACPRNNMSPILNGSIGPSRNIYDMHEQP